MRENYCFHSLVSATPLSWEKLEFVGFRKTAIPKGFNLYRYQIQRIKMIRPRRGRKNQINIFGYKHWNPMGSGLPKTMPYPNGVLRLWK